MVEHTPLLYLLWDDSQIWGLLAARAVKAMGLSHKIVLAREIAEGLLTRKPPSLLLVPGGNARYKAQSLGAVGIGAIRDYVGHGGHYLGFCGGAGLALTWGSDPQGLGLCPWQRARFDERMQHFMSGHLHVSLPESGQGRHPLIPAALPAAPPLPVWWPGRFAPQSTPGLTVLASYESPAEDFWLADLPIADLPPDTFSSWQDLYGLSFTPTFLAGQPCLIHGEYGKGSYVLSYSHLETPSSPSANQWFAHILSVLGGLEPERDSVPAWEMQTQEPLWEEPLLDAMWALFGQVERTGLQHGLLFRRTEWLLGWRTGIPGANLNNIRASLAATRWREPCDAAVAYWNTHKNAVSNAMEVFSKGCIQYLLAERLALTLSKSLPDAVPSSMLKDQRESLFGPPMQPGGLYKEIMEPLDRLACLQLSG